MNSTISLRIDEADTLFGIAISGEGEIMRSCNSQCSDFQGWNTASIATSICTSPEMGLYEG